jgi:cysteine synthase
MSDANHLAGLRNMHSPFVPAIYNPHLANREFLIEDEETFATARLLAREEGLRVGLSSAAVVAASLRLARELSEAGHEATIAMVLADSADRYLSVDFWHK